MHEIYAVPVVGLPAVKDGRWLVIVATCVGVALFVDSVVAGEHVRYAFLIAMGAVFATMVVTGTAIRFWRGGEVESAEAPGGWGVKFVARATRRPIRLLEERITSQMAELNERLYAVEQKMERLGPGGPGRRARPETPE